MGWSIFLVKEHSSCELLTSNLLDFLPKQFLAISTGDPCNSVIHFQVVHRQHSLCNPKKRKARSLDLTVLAYLGAGEFFLVWFESSMVAFLWRNLLVSASKLPMSLYMLCTIRFLSGSKSCYLGHLSLFWITARKRFSGVPSSVAIY